MQMTQSQFDQYQNNPLAMDNKVRTWFPELRADRYYMVSVWPVAGLVTMNEQVRTVKAKKISKSDQN